MGGAAQRWAERKTMLLEAVGRGAPCPPKPIVRRAPSGLPVAATAPASEPEPVITLHRITAAKLLEVLKEPGMSKTQLAVLATVASGRGAPVSREAIYLAMWGKKRRDRPENAYTIVNIAVYRLRQMGYRIGSRYGRGYWL